MKKLLFTLSLVAASLALAPFAGTSLSAQQLDQAFIDGLRWRSFGPANMGGRITEIEVAANDPKLWYAAAATGGLWKTTNSCTTFTPVFDVE
jgi:hypothetical protein